MFGLLARIQFSTKAGAGSVLLTTVFPARVSMASTCRCLNQLAISASLPNVKRGASGLELILTMRAKETLY